MKSFVAQYSRGRLALLLLGSIGFVLAGIWMAGIFVPPPRPGREWVGWAGILFFGACGVAILVRFSNTDHQLRISEKGIHWRQWSDATVPWEEIRDITVWSFMGQNCIVLHLRDPARFPSTTMLGRLAATNRALTEGDIAISLTGTNRSFADAMAAIEQFRPANHR